MSGEQGAAQLNEIARRIRAMGKDGRGLQKELYSALSRATGPLKEAAQQSARDKLPKSGGSGAFKTRLVKTGTSSIGGKTYVHRTRKTLATRKPPDPLAERVANSNFVTKSKSAQSAAVTFKARAKGGKTASLGSIDKGIVRHPVFGKWRAGTPPQRVPSGWFTEAVTKHEQLDQIREQLVKAIQNVAAQLRD